MSLLHWRKKRSATPDNGSNQRKRISKHTALTIICCVLLFALFAALPIFVNTAIGYVPIVSYLLLLLLSLAYLMLLKHGLEFKEIGASAGCTRGNSLPFQLAVVNRSFLPAVHIEVLFYISDLFKKNGSITSRRLTLPPRSEKIFDFGVRFDHIGTYQVGIKEVKIVDIFGIFHSAHSNKNLHEVAVKPRLYDVKNIEVSTESAQSSKKAFKAVINDGMDYSGVREYRWGDPIKAIHWKLSASTPDGEYFTRLYETVTNPGVEVLIDLESLPYSSKDLACVFDTVIEGAFSIERWASTSGMETELLFIDEKGSRKRLEGPFNDDYDELLERIPRISEGDGSIVQELLDDEASSIYAKNNLVVCTACINNALISKLIGAKSKRKTPILIAAIPPHLEDEDMKQIEKSLKRLGASGVAYAVLTTADELEERV